MLRVINSSIFVSITVLYAIFIFYLSVTSKIVNIKHHMDITLGHTTIKILSEAHLSVILKFLVRSLHFIERHSIDLGHVGIYFGFGVLLYFAFLSSRNQTLGKYAAACAILTGTTYGIMNEFFQTYLPYRTASTADAFSNLLGLVLAQMCVIVFVFILSTVYNKIIKKAENKS
jgi:VanZ family protein